MQVYLQDMAASGSKNPVEVSTGCTVADAFSAAGITVGKDIAIYVKRAPAQLTTRLSPGDVVSYQNTALKGAADEEVSTDTVDQLRKLTFEDIMSSGTREVPNDDSLFSGIFTERKKSGREALMRVGKAILADLELYVTDVNAEVAHYQKLLEESKKRQARAAYATNEFVAKNNIFSALAVMGQKENAVCVCSAIGVAVPDDDSPLWHTSAEDGK